MSDKQYNSIKKIVRKYDLKYTNKREISLFTISCTSLGYCKLLIISMVR